MARPRQQEAHRPGQIFRQFPHAFQRRDMVFPPGLYVGGGHHLGQVDRRAVHADRAGYDQQIVTIELGQIIPVPAGRQVGRVAIPVEQVEGRIIHAEQIIIDDIIPDQVAPAQQVEGRSHVAPVEKPLGRKLFDHLHLIVIDEQGQVAGLGEIHLCGEEGGAGDLIPLPPRRQQRQRRGQRGAGHAITDRMDALHLQQVAHRVDRVDLTAQDIIVPDQILHRGVGGFPRHQKHADPLIHRPFDEALFRRQVENIETVDPGREDDERRFQHRFRRWRIMNQLIEGGFVNDLARRRGDIAAQLKLRAIGMGQLPFLQVGEHMLQALDQIFAAAFDRLFHDDRVGEREIRRGQRVQHAGGREAQFLLHLGIDAIDRIGQARQIIRHEQIALADEVVKGMFRPGGIGEATVTRRRRAASRGGIGLIAQQAARIQETLPQSQSFVGEAGLDARHGFGIEGQHAACRARCLFQHQLLGAADDLRPLLHLFQGRQMGFHDIGSIHGHLAPPGIIILRRFHWRVAIGRVIARL